MWYFNLHSVRLSCVIAKQRTPTNRRDIRRIILYTKDSKQNDWNDIWFWSPFQPPLIDLGVISHADSELLTPRLSPRIVMPSFVEDAILYIYVMWNSINFVCCYTGCKHPLLWDISQHCDHLAIGRILDRKPQQPSISAVFTSLRSCSSGIGLPREWNKAKWPNDGCLYSLAISWDMRRVIKNQLSWWSFKALECWTNRWWFPHFLFLSNTALKDHQRKEEAQFLWYTVCKNNKQTIFEGGSPWTTEILNSAGIEWCNYTSIGPSWPWRNKSTVLSNHSKTPGKGA